MSLEKRTPKQAYDFPSEQLRYSTDCNAQDDVIAKLKTKHTIVCLSEPEQKCDEQTNALS